jgi:hypothetical protein
MCNLPTRRPVRVRRGAALLQLALSGALAALVAHSDMLPARWRLVAIVAAGAAHAVAPSPITRREEQ